MYTKLKGLEIVVVHNCSKGLVIVVVVVHNESKGLVVNTCLEL